MKASRIVLRYALGCAAALFACSNASAICTVFNAPPPRYVGDTASDGACTDNTIQSAITFVKNAGYVCPAKIYVTREHLYTSQHLNIDSIGTPLTIIGEGDGVHCGSTEVQICDPDTGCPPPPTAPLVTIDGSGSGGRVFSMTGLNNVSLRYLTIKGGAASSSASGGGISFDGTGSLSIDTSTISLNDAGYGGGINFNGNGGAATLALNAHTLIASNTAETSGGGIRMEGQARLFALQSPTLITFNHALGGYGGGIEVIGPARADIAATSTNGSAVVQFNDAQYGGGIAVAGLDSGPGGEAVVRLFAVDSQSPVGIGNNSASHTGGGIYLRPSDAAASLSQAVLCASDFRIDDNLAQEGSAIYADGAGDTGFSSLGNVYLNADPYAYCAVPETAASLGAVPCAAGVVCNTVSGNVTEDDVGTPTPGSAILMQDGNDLAAGRLLMRSNQGAHVLRTFGPDPYTGIAYMHNCLLADNEVSGELIRIDNDSDADKTSLVNCTLAGNSIGGDSVIYSGHDLTLTDSIISQPGVPTLAYSGNPANLVVNYVLSNDVSTLPVAIGVVQGSPLFVDAAQGDYHLRVTSLGIDYAPPVVGDDRDLDNLPRDQDLAPVPNDYGDRDLGAYERQYVCGADTIFCSGFDSFQ